MCVIKYGVYPFVEKPVDSFEELLKHTLITLDLYKGYQRTAIFGPISSPCKQTVRENVFFIQKTAELLGKKKEYAVLDLMSLRPVWHYLLSKEVEKIDENNSSEPTSKEFILKSENRCYAWQILECFTVPLIKSLSLEMLTFLNDYRRSYGSKVEFATGIVCNIPRIIFDGSML